MSSQQLLLGGSGKKSTYLNDVFSIDNYTTEGAGSLTEYGSVTTSTSGSPMSGVNYSILDGATDRLVAAVGRNFAFGAGDFSIEAYVNTYEGYSGAGDVLTKFGVNIRDEVDLTISKERFEDFIAPFMAGLDDGTDDSEMVLTSRPREGDLVFFPLGNRLFEVKFVEHEDPFYQLGKNYIYKLECELFEYEDEVIDTSIPEIDTKVEDLGHITDLALIKEAANATAVAIIGTGGVEQVFLNEDGSGYTSAPTITFSAPSSLPGSGTTATGVGILTTRGNTTSLEYIRMTHMGVGYGLTAPTITISGGGGTGAAATCSVIPLNSKGIQEIRITKHGMGYDSVPSAAISLPSLTPNQPASVLPIVGTASSQPITGFYILDSGYGFFSPPTVTIGTAATVGVGTFLFNEEVVGQVSNVAARVKSWDADTAVLQVGIQTGTFSYGERILGMESGANYELSRPGTASTTTDKYDQRDDFQFDAGFH